MSGMIASYKFSRPRRQLKILSLFLHKFISNTTRNFRLSFWESRHDPANSFILPFPAFPLPPPPLGRPPPRQLYKIQVEFTSRRNLSAPAVLN